MGLLTVLYHSMGLGIAIHEVSPMNLRCLQSAPSRTTENVGSSRERQKFAKVRGLLRLAVSGRTQRAQQRLAA